MLSRRLSNQVRARAVWSVQSVIAIALAIAAALRQEIAMVPLSFAGEEWLLTRSGALFWPRESALLVADLHLEKGSFFASRGQMIPPYDSRETLERAANAQPAFRPAVMARIAAASRELRHDLALGLCDEALAALRAKGPRREVPEGAAFLGSDRDAGAVRMAM